LREHFQLNADIVGESGVAADAELVAIALDAMRSFGLTHVDVEARVSDRRLLDALLVNAGVTDDARPRVYAVIDKRSREPANVSREKLEAATGNSEIADSVEAILACTDVASLVKRYSSVESATEHIERMRQYLLYVSALGFGEWVRLDLSIVRGLAYYTGIVFELFDTAGELRAICGGGRYDTLLATLGGVDLPALGFGMGDVVLGDLLRSKNLLPAAVPVIDFWIAADDDALLEDVMIIASELRRRNRSVEYALRPQQLGKQLKAAAGVGAKHVVLLLQKRFAAREVTVKDMASGAERSLPLEEFLNSLN